MAIVTPETKQNYATVEINMVPPGTLCIDLLGHYLITTHKYAAHEYNVFGVALDTGKYYDKGSSVIVVDYPITVRNETKCSK